MPTVTRCKYLAIGANVFVILLSLSILSSLYLFSLDSGDKSSESSPHQTLRQQGAVDESAREENTGSNSSKTFAYLPSSLGHFINWLGQSVSSSGGGGEESSSLFTAGRPLVVAAFLAYVLAIVGSIAIGLEHITLLSILAIIFVCLFASSLAGLVFSLLNAVLDSKQFILLDFWNCLLIAIICLSALQIYSTAYLIYKIFMERRVERSREYCLAKMVPNIEEL